MMMSKCHALERVSELGLGKGSSWLGIKHMLLIRGAAG